MQRRAARTDRTRPGLPRTAPWVLVAVAWAAVPVGAKGRTPEPFPPGGVRDGWNVFVRQQCIQCHSVWGVGGAMGPDLGRTKQQSLTAGRLAGAMWNHIPKMWSHMRRTHLSYPRISRAEMSDLFSFLLFVRYLDEPGDPEVGRRVLREKGCAHCHMTEGRPEQAAPNLRRWAGHTNPIVWIQRMWEHGPKMEQAMKQAGIAWPKLADRDLIDIMAYVRSMGTEEAKVYLRPGSAQAGARLFVERKCQSCHRPGGAGGDLATARLPRSLAALASRMWNHSPEMTQMMRAAGVARAPLTAQSMADVIAYVISLRGDDRDGDPERGRAVFRTKRCIRCHSEEGVVEGAAPDLKALSADFTPVEFAHAMWNHGVSMMDRMSETGVVWPTFDATETVDLITYLRSVAPRKRAATAASPVPPPALLPPIRSGASCVTAACHAGAVAGNAVHTPVAQGECESCHRLENAQTHQFQLVSDRSDLCYQCHDSSEKRIASHGPVAVGVCTACHDPHSSENPFGPGFTGNEVCFADMIGMTAALETVAGRAPDLDVTIPPIVMTPEKRAPRAAVPGGLRALVPAAPGAPLLPRPVPTAIAPAIAPPAAIQGGCVTSQCHAAVVAGPVVHGPTAQQQCDLCHRLIDEPKHRFELTLTEPDLCYECHERPETDTKFKHGPVALGMCTPCHDPHGAPNKFMLPESGNELCFMCHTEMASHVREARVQHAVVREKGCVACHDPHRGSIRFQLKKDQPDLCFDCHQPVAEAIHAATVTHAPMTTGKRCVNCHNPHGSDVEKILSNTQIGLCLGCHDRPLDTPNGPIIDMKSRIENNPEHHGPIRDGNCTGCHAPHGSTNFRILQHAFPRKFYSPFSIETYALCFACHEESIVLDERTTTLTDFRNGDKNLHYLHVNQEKGRTCRACHEIHAGTKPKRIKDFVPFGKWNYPVNFEKTDTGGRCAPGCHVPRAYDRQRAVIQK